MLARNVLPPANLAGPTRQRTLVLRNLDALLLLLSARFQVLIALVLLLGCTAAPPAATAPQADTTAALVAVDDAKDAPDAPVTAADTAPADSQLVDVVDAAPLDATAGPDDAAVTSPADTTPATTFSITTPLNFGPGLLHLRLIDYSTPVNEPTPSDVILFNAASPLPAKLTAIVPPGIWLPTAAWFGLDGQLIASSLDGATAGVITVTPDQAAPSAIALSINTPVDKSMCIAPPINPYFSAAGAYIVPFTDLGVSHLLEGLAWNGKWWMAANVEGIGSVNLASAGKNIDAWAPSKIGDCRHIARDNARLFCSERGPAVRWMDVDPTTNQMVQQGAIQLAPTAHAEGIAALQGKLYVALHAAGIALVAANPSGTPMLYAQGLVADAWAVAVLPDGKVIVADGPAGLKVLAPLQNGQTTVLSQLALPGLSAHLAVSGQTVAVGALGGGLHLLTVNAAGKLTLLGTLPAGPWPAVGVDVKDGMAYVAAGRALLAVPVPAAPVGQLSAVSATLTDSYTSLDVRAEGNLAYTAEYAYIRALKLDPTPPVAGPVAIHEAETWTKSGAKGSKVKFEAWLWNAGSAPLEVAEIVVTDMNTAAIPAGNAEVSKPIKIAPGASAKLSVAIVKTQAGPQQWLLNFASNDPARPWASTKLTESPLVGNGDVLPKLAYQDKDAKLVSVNDLAGGKPLLLIVASENCPVAYERLAAIAAQAQPWLSTGKIVAVNINPTDDPKTKEVGGFKLPFPELYAPLTSPAVGDWSEIADSLLALPGKGAIPPLPLVFVANAQGVLIYSHLGYAPAALNDALMAVGGP